MENEPSKEIVRPIGGISKFTEQTRNMILAALRVGIREKDAFQAASVSVWTGRMWLKRGIDCLNANGGEPAGPDYDYGKFYLDFKKIQSLTLMDNYKRITEIGRGEKVQKTRIITKKNGDVIEETDFGRGDWTALAWGIERVNDDYKQTPVTQNGQAVTNNNTIQVVYVNDWRGGTEIQEFINKQLSEQNDVIEGDFTEIEPAKENPYVKPDIKAVDPFGLE